MTTTEAPAAPATAQARSVPGQSPHHEMRWLVLGVVAIAQLMVVLDATIVNIALPSAQRALGFADTDRQWVVTAYALAFGSLLLLGGKLGDLFGRKTTFIVGLVGFAGASALGGAAQSFGVLIAARALQGVFGALLAPAALATLATTFIDPKERSKAFGIFGAVAGGGSAVGLVLGGVLTEYLSWRWCLYVNLFFAAAAVAGAVALLHNSRAPQRPRLDIPGTVLASGGLFCLVLGFSLASTDGWSNAVTITVLVLGVVLLAGFVLVQQRVAAPLLPLRVVLDRVRGTSYLAVGLSAIAIFGVFLFLTFYLQQVKGFSPIMSGVAFLPLTACIVTASTSSNILLLPRVGPRPLVATGMTFGAVGMFLFARLTPGSSYAGGVLPSLLLLGLGFGLIFAPAISSATYGVAPGDTGVASAMVNTMQQVGGSVGTALLSTIAASSTATFIRTHPGAGVAVRGAVHGYTTAFLVSGGIFVVGALLTAALLPSGVLRATHPEPAGAAPDPAPAPAGVRAAGSTQITGTDRTGTVEAAGPTGPARPADTADTADAARTTDTAARPTPATPTAAGTPIASGTPTTVSEPPMTEPPVGEDTLVHSDAPVPTTERPADPSEAAGVFGRVTAPDGTPLAGASLTLTDLAGRQLARARSDRGGAYRLTPSSGGAFLLICASDLYQPTASLVNVAGSALRHDVALTAATRVRGRVTADGGASVAEAFVTLTDVRGQVVGSAVTDRDGGYLLDDLVAGDYTLTATADRHQPSSQTLTLPESRTVDVDITLVGSGELSGVVRVAGTAQPLPGAMVTVVDAAGAVVGHGLTDSAGRYHFGELSPGSYTVTSSGYAPVAASAQVSGGRVAATDLTLGQSDGELPRGGARPAVGRV